MPNGSETYSDAVGRESGAPFHNTDLHASGRTDSAGNQLAVISEFKGRKRKLAAVSFIQAV